MSNAKSNLAKWRSRLILEEQWMYALWSHFSFLAGYVIFIFAFWDSAFDPKTTYFLHEMCKAKTLQSGLPNTVLVSNSTSHVLFISLDTRTLSHVCVDGCVIDTISYAYRPVWRHIAVLSLLGFQTLLDIFLHFFPHAIIGCIPTFKYRHSTSFLKKSLIIVSSLSCLAVIVIDLYFDILPSPNLLQRLKLALNQLQSGSESGSKMLVDLLNQQRFQKELWGLALIVGMFRVLLVFGAHPRLSLLTSTIEAGFVEIFSFVLIVIVIYVIFSVSGYLLFSEESLEFRTIPSSLWTQFNMLLSEWPFDSLFATSNQAAVYLYTLSFGFILFFTVMRVYLAIILEAFQQTHRAISSDPAHCSVPRDIWIMMLRAYYRLTQKWPTRSEVIKYIEHDGGSEPPNYDRMKEFYTRNMSELFVELNGRQAEYASIVKSYIHIDATVSSLVAKDPYILAVAEFRRTLQQARKKIKRQRSRSRKEPRKVRSNAPPLLLARSSPSDRPI